MIEKPFAESFTAEWIASWNSHDLDRILSHYSEDFEFSSPVIVERLGVPSGKLKGREAVGAYWAKGLARRPDLKFGLRAVLTGVSSVVIHYTGLDGVNASEHFDFGADGKVLRSSAHYG
jgi:hypothetical protein